MTINVYHIISITADIKAISDKTTLFVIRMGQFGVQQPDKILFKSLKDFHSYSHVHAERFFFLNVLYAINAVFLEHCIKLQTLTLL